MNNFFAIVLSKDKTFGFLIFPYRIIAESDERLILDERLTPDNYPENYEISDIEKKIIDIANGYSDSYLQKLFSKSKDYKTFISSLTTNSLTKSIRPYIEHQIDKILHLALNHNIPLFLKDEQYKNECHTNKIHINKNPAKTVFNFTKHIDKTTYYLSIKQDDSEIKLTGRKGIFLTNQPCWLIVDNRLYHFNDIDGKKVKPFFEKVNIEIPARLEEKYYKTFILNAIKQYEVNCSGFEITNVHAKNWPLLIFEKNWNDKSVLILKFRYDEYSFLAKSNTNNIVTLSADEGKYIFHKLVRDDAWENSRAEYLVKLGLATNDGINFILPEYENPDKQDFELVNWVNEFNSVLKKEGFEIKQKFFKKKFFEQKIELDYKVKRQSDWFDIYATVYFGDFKIPFSRLRNHIKTGKREYRLPNGEIAVLPEEWFTEHLDVMIFGEEIMGNILRLAKQHFFLLPRFPEGVDKKYLSQLKTLADKQFDAPPPIPATVKAELRNYQKTGFAWLYSLYKNEFGGCLADDMGLGKTLQTLTLLQKTIREVESGDSLDNQKNKKSWIVEQSLFDAITPQIKSAENKVPASLIVCPKSVIYNWKNEVDKFVPDLTVYIYSGTNRDKDISKFNNFHLIITTYGVIRNDIELLGSYEFFYLVLDESQNIKNPDSKTYQSVLELQSSHRLVLTGTPIENGLGDLWAQMNFLNRKILGDQIFFKEKFIVPIERWDDEQQEKRLRTLIQPFVLRRTKYEVAQELPPVTEQIIFCDMSEEQREIYESEKSRFRNAIMDFMEEKQPGKASFLVLQGLTTLRLVANHPVLTNPYYKHKSGKFNEITRILRNLYYENHKVLIFSSFVKHLDIIAKFIKKEKWKYNTITGKTTKRQQQVDSFQKNSDIHFFLISIKAGGVGINLTSADYVLILDPWWNPAVENQAVSRAHRIGQEKNVMVYRFITKATIEEKIQLYKEQKTKLADTFINSNNPFKELPIDNIIELFE